MQRKRILVLGGYGLIGQALVRRLHQDGHEITAVGRDAATGNRLAPYCSWAALDISRQCSPEDWLPLLEGIDAVVNASGALQTGLRDNLAAVQQEAIIALVRACERKGIKQFVQISAPRAEPDASTEFMRTKAAADNAVRGSSLDWVILRPGLVISPNAYGGTALLRMLAAFPAIVPVVHGNAPTGTVSINEVAEAVSLSVSGSIPARSELDLIEGDPKRLRDVVPAFREWLGFPKPLMVFELPLWMAAVVTKAADALGYLGWRSPLRSTALEVIREGVVADPTAYEHVTGRVVGNLQETLSGMPATIQERWFARLFLAMPIMVAVLAIFWLASGIIGLARLPKAAAHLAGVLGGSGALAAVAAGSFLDIILGAAILYRPWASKACFGMIAVTAGYLVLGTVFAPSLWLDPLGPLVKTIPTALLAWVASMTLEER